ncbi:MAG TPA: hypothetical protein VME69_09735 [Methylocella sp.]|nr:hypothetical protein [Methylocella sp.]
MRRWIRISLAAFALLTAGAAEPAFAFWRGGWAGAGGWHAGGWHGGGWGGAGGWHGGWGGGYGGTGAAVAAGVAAGALAAGAAAAYAYPAYGCMQHPVYDQWGRFIGYSC